MARYVERNKVIELFKKYQPTLATNVCEFGDELEKLQTEDVAPIVRGKWLRGDKIRCSVCGNSYNDLVKNPEETIELLFASKYCPFCGTRVKSLKEVTEESEEE